jgi:hypothetical protein
MLMRHSAGGPVMRTLSCILCSALLGACAAPCGTQSLLDLAGAWVSGKVVAPAGWSGGTGSASVPVGAAEIALADANGDAVAGLFHQRSDDAGGFLIQGVPKDNGFVVTARFTRADGTEATLETLASPNDRTTSGDITLGTTLATMLATEGLTGAIGQVDAATFQQLASAFDQRVAGTTAPPDTAAALVLARGWVAGDPALGAQVAALHTQAATPKITAAQRDTSIARSSDHGPLDALSPVY